MIMKINNNWLTSFIAVLVGSVYSTSAATLPNAANDVAPPSWRGSASAVAAGSTFTKALFTAVNGNDGPLVAGAYPATPATWTIGTNYFTTYTAPSTALQIYSNSWMYNQYGTSYVSVTKGAGTWSANALASISHLVEGTWKLATPSSASFLTLSIPDKTEGLPVDSYRYAYIQVAAEYAASPFIPLPAVAVSGATQAVDTAFQYTGAYGNNGIYWSNCVSVWRIPTSRTVPTNVITLTCTNTSQTVLIDNVIVDTVTVVKPTRNNFVNVDVVSGQNYAIVDFGALNADATLFPNPQESCTPNTSFHFPAGQTTPVTCTAKDLFNGVHSYGFSVQVKDAPPAGPTITTCGAPQTADLGGSCLVPMPDMGVGAVVENGSIVPALQVPAIGTPVGVGPHTVTLTADDGLGHTATCDTLFTVTAIHGPVAQPMQLATKLNKSQLLDVARLRFAGGDNRVSSFFDIFTELSTAGTVVKTNGNTQILYTPLAGSLATDHFGFVVQDCSGQFGTNYVTVTISPTSASQNMLPPTPPVGGVATIKAQGIPGVLYILQHQLVDPPGPWTQVGDSQRASPQGRLSWTDNVGADSYLYRTQYVPE